MVMFERSGRRYVVPAAGRGVEPGLVQQWVAGRMADHARRRWQPVPDSGRPATDNPGAQGPGVRLDHPGSAGPRPGRPVAPRRVRSRAHENPRTADLHNEHYGRPTHIELHQTQALMCPRAERPDQEFAGANDRNIAERPVDRSASLDETSSSWSCGRRVCSRRSLKPSKSRQSSSKGSKRLYAAKLGERPLIRAAR